MGNEGVAVQKYTIHTAIPLRLYCTNATAAAAATSTRTITSINTTINTTTALDT